MRVLVLHSAYGLRPAIHDAAKRLQSAGHLAHAPDLYGGRTADTLEDALALRDAIGRDVLRARALAETQAWAPEVLLGFSLGASLVQRIALSLGAPKRLVLFHGIAEAAQVPVSGLRIQAHVAQPDEHEPEDELAAWRASFVANGAEVELLRYSGAGHLFSDPALPDFHPQAAALAWERTLGWLSR